MGGYSPAAYRFLVEQARGRGYRFCGFESAAESDARSLYLRHDVDFSLTAAGELAELNSELGIRATFFVQVRSPIYNVLSDLAADQLRHISECGQDVGVHVRLTGDCRPHKIVSRDYAVILEALESARPVFSVHNPPAGLAGGVSDLDVPGFVNAYSRRFAREDVYVSDSNMQRSLDDFITALDRQPSSLQLLLHPEYWILSTNSTSDAFARILARVIRDQQAELVTNERFGRTFPLGVPEEVLERVISDLEASA